VRASLAALNNYNGAGRIARIGARACRGQRQQDYGPARPGGRRRHGSLVQPPATSAAALPALPISSIRTITISGDPALAPERYRFWSLRGVPDLLVCDAEAEPPIILCFVHQSRDLPDGA